MRLWRLHNSGTREAMKPAVPNDIGPDTPLRLDMAARVAFPAGGMTASGLRREAARGRLTIERIAGKDFTTLSAIATMREKCRAQKPPTALPQNPARWCRPVDHPRRRTPDRDRRICGRSRKS